jgi:phosphatidylglycerol:prolipoprotein diacylglycerol transferase
MMPVLLFPQFDPVIVQIGPFGIRWYALAYIAGLVLGWRLLRYLVRQSPPVATPVQADDFLTWATLGVVLGGRLGYVLFYQPGVYLTHPGMILAVWEGGMSFHGGALGVAVAIVWFCRRNAIPLLEFADRVAVGVPIGLGLGRIANFVNGELWGRPAPEWLPWAMIFPNGGPVPRHPSQLYEALLEGVLLFVCLIAIRLRFRRPDGLTTACFFLLYPIMRIIGEVFRVPDAPLTGPFTRGQFLSLFMFILALGFFWHAWKMQKKENDKLKMTNDR